ncbi:hypothetical protein HELRODRAFT_172834 [Helobdella robusta]|uniref:Uncharacterized protein n=1 Tax=Helobdella robusta TaxID=6412 RepID=T1F5Z7_HELRO|nr:hypothetical protein HELRODRAFT_172834 [Helobdella robusta]ESO04444.1 hypothetical protein HELRODRAFT_172834 [Helobdella robusta]
MKCVSFSSFEHPGRLSFSVADILLERALRCYNDYNKFIHPICTDAKYCVKAVYHNDRDKYGDHHHHHHEVSYYTCDTFKEAYDCTIYECFHCSDADYCNEAGNNFSLFSQIFVIFVFVMSVSTSITFYATEFSLA